jgi:hypothetical protein
VQSGRRGSSVIADARAIRCALSQTSVKAPSLAAASSGSPATRSFANSLLPPPRPPMPLLRGTLPLCLLAGSRLGAGYHGSCFQCIGA